MFVRRLPVKALRGYSKNVITSYFGEAQLPPSTVDEFVMENWSKWEDKTAIECGLTGKRLTYRQLRLRSKYFASSLAELGMSKKTILFVLPNSPDYPLALLGALQASATVSPANPFFTPGELKYQLKNSGAECVVTDPRYIDRVLAATKDTNIPIICTGQPITEGTISFEEMSNNTNVKTDLLHPQEERLRQLAMLPYSSGTTGLPKGVRTSHRNLTSNLAISCHPTINYSIETTEDHQDVVPGILPFFHAYGFSSVLLRALRMGSKIISLPKFDTKHFFEILSKSKDIVLYAVPPMINILSSHPQVKRETLEGLRFTIVGAAPCGAADITKFLEKKPHTMIQGYGMTETSGIIFCPHLDSKDYSTIGGILPNATAKIVDPETGEALERGAIGELMVKGPQVMESYHNNPKATANTLDDDGWLHTGDMGYCNEEDNFYIVDRLKEIIKVKGYQVSPAELEALLRQHPNVAEAGVTSTECPHSGEIPVAFLVPAPGCSIDPLKISEWLCNQVAPHKRLGKVLVVQNIPKSPSGKILRRVLKEIVKKEVQIN